ncbi:MAG: hypothetical protein ABSG94_04150 [Brevinematales bacterium]|jgi:hypothetical protein
MAVKKIGGKKTSWRLYLIIVAAVIVVSGGVYFWFTFHYNNLTRYQAILSQYYKFRAEDNKDGLNALEAGDFEDELSSLNVKGAGYVLYAYTLSDETFTNKTNEVIQVKKITFSITLNENNSSVSYIGEAYLADQGNNVKIEYIKKIYTKGVNITKLWEKSPYPLRG